MYVVIDPVGVGSEQPTILKRMNSIQVINPNDNRAVFVIVLYLTLIVFAVVTILSGGY